MSSNPSISWKKRPKFNPSRLPKFRSEENAWESVKSHRQHYHDAMHKVENVVSEVTVARGAKLKNYETPEVHLVLPKRKKYSWELEEDMLKSLEGIEVYYEEVPIYSDNKSIELKFEYKEKT